MASGTACFALGALSMEQAFPYSQGRRHRLLRAWNVEAGVRRDGKPQRGQPAQLPWVEVAGLAVFWPLADPALGHGMKRRARLVPWLQRGGVLWAMAAQACKLAAFGRDPLARRERLDEVQKRFHGLRLSRRSVGRLAFQAGSNGHFQVHGLIVNIPWKVRIGAVEGWNQQWRKRSVPWHYPEVFPACE